MHFALYTHTCAYIHIYSIHTYVYIHISYNAYVCWSMMKNVFLPMITLKKSLNTVVYQMKTALPA